MPQIHYLVGDATEPQGSGNKIIAHVCNDRGGWGSGFVLALSKKWKEPENEYRSWFDQLRRDKVLGYPLGQVQFVELDGDLTVANMIGQHDTKWNGDIPPVRYDRIRQCLNLVAEHAIKINATVHAPRFGAGLAGGHWKTIEGLIEETLIKAGVEVYIYDLPTETKDAH